MGYPLKVLGENVTISDEVTSHILDLKKRIEGINYPIGQATFQLTQQHIAGLDSTKANSLGGERSHYYEAAAKSTSFQVVLDGVQIRVDQLGFAQRYYGGKIAAFNAKYLTIPARAEAYNHLARDFTDLRFIKFKSGTAALVQNNQTRIKFGKRGVRNKGEIGGAVYFWLFPEVNQKPDHSVIPTDDKYEAAIDKTVKLLLTR